MEAMEQVGELLEDGDHGVLAVGAGVHLGRLLQVHARAEGRAGARHHDDAGASVDADLVEGVAELREQLPRERIATLGPVECEDRDRSLVLSE